MQDIRKQRFPWKDQKGVRGAPLSSKGEPFSVGLWSVNPAENLIENLDLNLRLEPKVMDLLVFLAERAGQVVTREEILARVWDGAWVGNSTLNWSVAQLRKALGDDARNPRFIKTIPKRGYRLIARVCYWEGKTDAAREQCRAHLETKPLKAVTRRSLMIAACFLLGTIDTRITKKTESWPSGEVSLQSTYNTVASSSPTSGEPGQGVLGEALSARELYLLGCHHMKRRGTKSLKKAISFFKSAIQKNPYAAEGYAELANAYGLMAVWGNLPFESVDGEREWAIQRALALNPNAAEALVSLGCLQYHRGHLQDAVTSFRRAIALDPNIATAHLWLGDALRAQGHFQSASESQQIALRLDPLSPIGHLDLGYSLHMLGDHEKALSHMKTAIRLDPDFAAAHQEIGETHYRLGHPALALTWFQRAQTLEPERGSILRHSTRLLLDLNRPDLAKPYLEKCNQVDPRHPETMDLSLKWACTTGGLESHWSYLQGQMKLSPRNRTLARNGALTLYLMARLDDSLAAFETIDGGLPLRVSFENWLGGVRLAFLLQKRGNLERTDPFLEEVLRFTQTQRSNGYNLANLHFIAASALAAVDQPQAALKELEKAIDGGWMGLWSLKHEPHLRQLANYRGYDQAVARLQAKSNRALTAFLSQP